ncbi:MAG: FimV/HubP family polar landmark protein [Moraxellaceae bacterium]
MVLRKLAVALLSVGVMLPGLGHALAVRDLQTKSALGEPYQGEIELVEIGDLNPDEIKVTLATQEDFERLSVDRVYFLTDLRFDVVLNPGGRSFVKITSAKPVREPFLNFVVRIAWPGNTRLQEVTALLDPPVMADTAPQAVVQPVAVPQAVAPAEYAPAEPAQVTLAPEETVAEAPAPVVPLPFPVAEKPVRQPAPVAQQPQPVPQADVYRTRSGDTMWKVGEQLRPSDSVSVSQTMVAIQRANPKAFAGDNINQLKRGQVLRIPSESQIREVSAQEAAASIREQTQEWRSAQPAPAEKPALDAQQVNATAPQQAPVAAAPVAKPEVKLLAAQTGKAGASSAGKDQGAAKPADTKKLDENRVKAEAAKAEKEKLAAKVGTLDTKVKANDKQLEVQNAKLADLQAKLKDQQAKAAAAKAEADAKAAAAAAAAKAAPVAAKPTATAEELDALTSPDATPTATTETAAADTAPVLDAKPLPAPAPVKPAVVVESEPVEESSSLPLIAGGAGLLALLGGAFFFMKRRREKAEEEEALAELEGMEDRLADIGGTAPDVSDSFVFGGADRGDLSGHSEDFSLPDASFDDLEPAPVSAPAQDRVLADPLEEVEQYLAFERYPQAAGFLVKAIAANPHRSDLRLKLLEVYAHLDDHHGFAEQEDWFEQSGDIASLARAEELKASMSALPVAKGDDELLAYEPGLAKAAATSAASMDDDIASLEDLEMDFNASVSASSPALQSVTDADLDLDADFSLDVPAAKSQVAAADSGLSLDEDLDFSFDSKPAAAAPVADDLSFELDDAAFDAAPAATASTTAADEGMDFSLDEVSLDEPQLDTSSAGLGLGDIADFDMDAPVSQSETPAPVAKAADDDLSFGLDDLEGDFNLDEASASDLSFDETVQADSGMNDAAADFDAALNLDEVAEVSAPVAAPAMAAADSTGMDDEFDFLADTDENATKLDLARAYIDMGDMEGARDILQEVLNEGNAPQKDEAKGLLAQVG